MNKLSSRVKSFSWRTGMMILAFALMGIAENLGVFELSASLTTLLGLALGEVSKYLNNASTK